MKSVAFAVASVLITNAALAAPDPAVDALARDVERAQSVRDVKTLQRTFAQYAQFGLWTEMGSLFARKGIMESGATQLTGPQAITGFLTTHDGSGHQGLEPGAVNTQLVAAPVVNLSLDGRSAKGRWDMMMLRSDGHGHASIEGGILENEYVKEDGVWKFADQHYYPLYSGPYETGWTNVSGSDLPIVPYHYNGDTAGIPIPAPVGSAPQTALTLPALESRVRAMNDEDHIRNLQAAYNYYVSRKMWDDVTDLFAPRSVLEIGGLGLYDGQQGVRKALERMGPAGLAAGQLNDRLVFDDVAEVLPGGTEAYMRGYELGLIGDAARGEQHWEVNVFDNRFVKEGGIWKVREMRIFPLLRSEYHAGWGKSRLSEPVPTGPQAPDRPMPAADSGKPDDLIPAFHAANPVTGRKVLAPPGKQFVAISDLTTPGVTTSVVRSGSTAERLAETDRRLAVSKAYDGAENVNSAYGHLIDDFQWADMSKLFGRQGAKEVPFAGYYSGNERITRAVFLEYGDQQVAGRARIAFHWLIQPMIQVAADGRSASARSYLFHPDTAKVPGSASLFGAMYPDNQFVLEEGVWRIWNLSLDEPYFSLVGGWQGGWAGPAVPQAPPVTSAPPPPVAPPQQQHYFGDALVGKFAPDVPITALGAREEHFRGGTGETWDWPQILPMWWNYRNPVSGRTPGNFLPDCVPCDYAPGLSMSHHGYELPPTGPEPDMP